MHCSLHSQHAAALKMLTSHIPKFCLCCCRAEERTTQTRHLQRLWCSADVMVQVSNSLTSTPDQTAVHAVNSRSVSQHVGRTMVMQQPQQPPVLQDQPKPAGQPRKASQVQEARFQQHSQSQQNQPLQDTPREAVQPAGQTLMQYETGNQLGDPQHNTSKRGRRWSPNQTVQLSSETAQRQQQQQQQRQKVPQPARSHRRPHLRPVVKYKPCNRGGSMKHAAAISSHLQQGRQLLLPAGNGMQLARGVAALASARTLLLGHSSAAGLVFQPSFPAAAAAGRQQPATANQHVEPPQELLQEQLHHTSSSREATLGSSIMMFVSGLQESQLRRFEQQPLIAAPYSSVHGLASAAFARVCERGYTAVRAAGPDALAVALHAVTHARRKLLGCGLDLAVVPITEFVDVDSLPDADGQQQQVADYNGYQQMDYGATDEQARQCVRITVLHIMRCEPQQPWKLLPWRPEPQQLPAVRYQQQQLEQQQLAWQQQGLEKLQLEEGQRLPQRQSAVQEAAAVLGEDLPGLHMPLGQAGIAAARDSSSSTCNSSSQANYMDGSLWDSSEALQGYPCDLVELEGEEWDVAKHSHAGGVVPRQPAVLLLQKQRKTKRQLVAAAQSLGHVNRGSCSSGGCTGSGNN